MVSVPCKYNTSGFAGLEIQTLHENRSVQLAGKAIGERDGKGLIT